MIYLLKSGRIGIVDTGHNCVCNVHQRWMDTGFLEGLEFYKSIKVAVAYEIVAQTLIAEELMFKMYSDISGENMYEDDNRFQTVIFPIVRRTITAYPNAHKYVPEIIGMAKVEYGTQLCMALYSNDESAIEHFYNNILPKWSEWHKDRKYSYKELKENTYRKYLNRINIGRSSEDAQSFEGFIPVDYEAEFCAYVASKIENMLREKYKEYEEIY